MNLYRPLRSARATLIAVSLVLLASPLAAAGLIDRAEVADAVTVLDLWLREQIASGVSPGVSIAVVHDQELVWANGYGLADLESRRPATAATLYRIGSVRSEE